MENETKEAVVSDLSLWGLSWEEDIEHFIDSSIHNYTLFLLQGTSPYKSEQLSLNGNIIGDYSIK